MGWQDPIRGKTSRHPNLQKNLSTIIGLFFKKRPSYLGSKTSRHPNLLGLFRKRALYTVQCTKMFMFLLHSLLQLYTVHCTLYTDVYVFVVGTVPLH